MAGRDGRAQVQAAMLFFPASEVMNLGNQYGNVTGKARALRNSQLSSTLLFGRLSPSRPIDRLT
ncbi:hypothetical protein IAQ61_005914 [Plenodomus lingam]|uniref:uncharacterized protein n=1 Tax=Leptosphaeria maculans TaxID=5022 RepID=UPI00332EE72B|nr:hypothetical protein IAQ61_005914 [Plenodomus lingam]